MSELYRPVVKI